MEELLSQLKSQISNSVDLAAKLEAIIRIVNEIEPSVFDRIKIGADGNPKKIG